MGGGAAQERRVKRLGYRYEGTFRQHLVNRGRNRDTAWFSMLDREWPRCGTALEHWLYRDDSIPLAKLRNVFASLPPA